MTRPDVAPVFFDSHAHLDLPAFDADREAVWARARAAGVTAVVVPGVEPSSWDRTAACALPGERWVALGIHPQALPDLDEAAVEAGLQSLAARARACGAVAIGECGLDGAIDPARAPWERQRRVLLAQVEVARALDLPLLLHVFRAHGEALATLRQARLPARPGVVHSYSGSADLVRAYLALGLDLSFAGALTRPGARRPVEAARVVPAGRLLLETDAPDQRPAGAEGARCEPAHLVITARRIAEVRGEPLADLAARTTANARRLFGLDGPTPPRQ